MPLTPNNREEHWLQGMVDGQTTLEPNKRREYWYKEIVDAIGSGGGGGTGGGVLVVNDDNGTLDKTWKEISDAFDAGTLVHLYQNANGNLTKTVVNIIATNNTDLYGVGAHNAQYATTTENGYPASL